MSARPSRPIGSRRSDRMWTRLSGSSANGSIIRRLSAACKGRAKGREEKGGKPSCRWLTRRGVGRRRADRGRLTPPSYADIMSDMKTFTVRELDRSPGVVLEASRIEGKARIRARGGQTYIIMPEPAPPRRITSLPNFAARRAALLAKPLSPEFTRKFDRALAGE